MAGSVGRPTQYSPRVAIASLCSREPTSLSVCAARIVGAQVLSFYLEGSYGIRVSVMKVPCLDHVESGAVVSNSNPSVW